MRYTGTYAVVLVLHLLAAVFVVGPLAVAAVTSPRLARGGRLEALRTAQRTTRGGALASIVVVLLGSAMIGLGDVGGQWEFSQLWVSASFALSLLAVGLTLGLVAPAQQGAVEALEAGQDAGGTTGRMAVGGGLAMLAWAAVVVLMVTKPGV
jgi:hypothetical protein